MEKKHYNVVAAVIVDNDEVLCMQRGQTKFEYTSYKWEFPGGKIEPGEMPDEALHREILEEMAMDVRVDKHLVTVEHVYSYYKSKLSSFRRKSKRPIVSMPSSLRRGMMWSFTMIIFLKESSMFINERDSWISFSLSGMDNADCT